jgi:hypothetical protein
MMFDDSHKIDWANTAFNCISILAGRETPQIDNTPYGLVMLDHDLGDKTFVDSGREDCGYEVVRWIIKNENPNYFPLIIVHSWNIVAGNNMVNDLWRAGFRVHFIPFGASGFKRIFTQLTDKL